MTAANAAKGVSAAKAQPWLNSAALDGTLVLLPPLLATAVVLLWPGFMRKDEVSPLLWLVLVVGIDVAHVYSSLYRTYLDPRERERRGGLLLAAPLVTWIIAMVAYSLDTLWFWRILAYFAVFHFVRQQYGFMMLYRRQEPRATPYAIWDRRIDAAAIYAATLWPLLYWHLHLPRAFSWFVAGDFLSLPWPTLDQAGLGLYCAIMAIYVTKELVRCGRERWLNVPKNLVLLGTALSWAIGIIWLNGDLAFTITNVVAHGVPYVALVWIFGRRAERSGLAAARPRPSWSWYARRHLPVFLGLLLLFAYAEEALWDGLVWREHGMLFPFTQSWGAVAGGTSLLSWLVPLLAVPQMTHYVLDGYIWRRDSLITARGSREESDDRRH